MSRMKRAACKGGCGGTARRVKWAQYCSPCWVKMGSPKGTCSACDGEFSKDTMNGRRCRPCVSEQAHAKRVGEVYGLLAGEYDALLRAQDGRCCICQNRPRSVRLAVDHDHTTGLVRGLLCKRCNKNLLGAAHDDVALLERAIQYLEHPPAIDIIGERKASAE